MSINSMQLIDLPRHGSGRCCGRPAPARAFGLSRAGEFAAGTGLSGKKVI